MSYAAFRISYVGYRIRCIRTWGGGDDKEILNDVCRVVNKGRSWVLAGNAQMTALGSRP